MLLVLLFAFIIIGYLLFYFTTRNLNYWKIKNVPGPQPIPFFGNIKDSVMRRSTIGVLIKQYYDEHPNEKLVGIYRMTTPALLIRDPDIVKHVLIKDFDIFVDRGVEFSKEGLGLNLFHADGDIWRVLRNKFTPLFTSGKLKNMLYLMIERGEKFNDYVDTICQKQPEQDIIPLVQNFTMSTIAACAFGIDLVVHEQEKTLKEVDANIFSANYLIELDFMFPGILRKVGSSMFPKYLTKFFEDMVNMVITQRNGVPTNRKDFMDLILELRQAGKVEGTKKFEGEKINELEITDSIIAAQAFVFYAAGYETSATTMGFMLYQLALNQEVQEKLVAEIDDVLKRNNGKLNYEAITEMVYMSKVFDETLRMYPPVDTLQRCVKVNYKIPGTDVTIEKGQMVLISTLGLHYDPKYYSNPEKFDPERFAPENTRGRHPCAYVPFGAGPRNCIGMRFAQLQTRVCLIHFLSKFKVEPTINTTRHMQFNPRRIILGPISGIHVNVLPRNK